MPRVKRFNEDEVLAKAMHLFWERGYSATSIQDLVDRLGINRASLYATYGGKEELFDRAFMQYLESTGSWLEQLFNKETSVKKGFKTLFEKAIEEGAEEGPSFFFALHHEITVSFT